MKKSKMIEMNSGWRVVVELNGTKLYERYYNSHAEARTFALAQVQYESGNLEYIEKENK